MYVWDLPLRLFHWLLVISMIGVYTTGSLSGLWLSWHSHCGIFILALIIFRIVWGFVGSSYARFASFAPTPKRWRAYFSATWPGIGHSPLGALSIFALLGLSLIQALTGLFTMNDEIDYYAPLYAIVSSGWSHRLTSWHSYLFDALFFLIAMHLLVIAYYAGVKRQNLLIAMFTGKIKLAKNIRGKPLKGGGILPLLLAISLAASFIICIESGMLLHWLTPITKSLHQSTTLSTWLIS